MSASELLSYAIADYEDNGDYVDANKAVLEAGAPLNLEHIEHFRYGLRELNRAIASLTILDVVDDYDTFIDEVQKALARAAREMWHVEGALGAWPSQLERARAARLKETRDASE